MSTPIVVIARWQVAEEAIDEVLALLPALRQRTLEEPGCLGYEVLRGLDDGQRITIVERYRDRAAIDAHRDSAHYRELVAARIVPLLRDRQVELLTAA